MRIRVLFVAGSLRLGGSERVLTEVLRGLKRSAFEPHLALLAREGEFLNRVEPDVPVHALGARRARWTSLPLARLCWNLRPHVVFSFSAQLNAAAILAKPILPRGTRVLVREGANITLQQVAGRLRGVACRMLYPHADAVICQSQDMAQRIACRFGVPQRKLIHIYNPVDATALWQAAAGCSPYSGPGPHLVAVSRFVPVKGVDLLIEAMVEVLRQRPGADLTLVGSGPMEEELRSLAARRGVQASVHFPGWQTNPFPFVGHADLLVVPSRSEALPNAALEALALGTPVVATDCPGGIREIATRTKHLWLAGLDAGALAQTIAWVLENQGGNFGLEPEFLCEFSPARIISLYETLMARLAGPQPAGSMQAEKAAAL
ncbi:MAG: glycosyltransferase [Chlamydiota bacterium]